ncbi:MAG: hypothetical protein U1F52_07560 [Burkholderiales bacterium]
MARKLFTNARVVTATEVFLGTVELHAGRIVRVDLGATNLPGAEDCAGDYLLPGLVDLCAGTRSHRADRRHRATVSRHALVSRDLQWAVNGVTTVCHTVPLEDASVFDGAVEAIRSGRRDGGLRVDHWLHLDATADPASPAETAFRSSLIRCLSLDCRLPVRRVLESPCLALAREQHCAILGTGLRAMEGVRLAAQAGASVCRDPSTLLLARAIREHGMLTATAATDVLAGVSPGRAGRSARLAQRGCIDVLTTGESPLSLLQLPFVLRDAFGWSLPTAVIAASGRPADLAGFHDRGRIALGLRADLVRVREASGTPIPVATWRGGDRVA